MTDPETEQMAACLAALGNPVRLSVFRRLVKSGRPGMNFGALTHEMNLAPSTLAHHLASLVQTGLVVQERAGRETLNRANFAGVTQLQTFLTRQCCADESVSKPGTAK